MKLSKKKAAGGASSTKRSEITYSEVPELKLDYSKPLSTQTETIIKRFLGIHKLDPLSREIVLELERTFARTRQDIFYVKKWRHFARHFRAVPDQHRLRGKSWNEVLNGVSRYHFDKAFNEIGMYYKSRSEMPRRYWDRFQGKRYFRVFDSRDGRTYYHRNDKFISEYVLHVCGLEEEGANYEYF